MQQQQKCKLWKFKAYKDCQTKLTTSMDMYAFIFKDTKVRGKLHLKVGKVRSRSMVIEQQPVKNWSTMYILCKS